MTSSGQIKARLEKLHFMSKKRQWASICTPIFIPAVDEPRKTCGFLCNTVAQRQKILHPKLTCNDALYVIPVRAVRKAENSS